MGMRFASGNVYYMNRTFTARHMNCVGSPLGVGFVSPLRYHSVASVPLTGLLSADGRINAELAKLSEPIGSTRAADAAVLRVLMGFDCVPLSVLKDAFVCASEDVPDRL